MSSDYSVAEREEAEDYMAEYPGFGELRSFGGAIDAEQVSFSWRLMPPGTGGRGSYGHKHATQEEIMFVVAGTVTFKIGDDVFEAGPKTAVRDRPPRRSLHPQRRRRRGRGHPLLGPGRRRARRTSRWKRTSGPSSARRIRFPNRGSRNPAHAETDPLGLSRRHGGASLPSVPARPGGASGGRDRIRQGDRRPRAPDPIPQEGLEGRASRGNGRHKLPTMVLADGTVLKHGKAILKWVDSQRAS